MSSRPSPSPLLRAFAAGAMMALTGCASSATPPPVYQASTRTDAPPPLAPPPVTTSLNATRSSVTGPPSLGPAQSVIVGMPSTRVSVNANGSDLADVIASVARQAGLNPIIDPAIRGPISTNMQNVSVGDAMLRLVGSQYQYRVQNGALVVGPIQLVQQTYEVSYLQMTRSTTASTVVSRNLTGSTSGGTVTNPGSTGTGASNSSAGQVASGTDVIQSSSNSDVWGELKVGLRTILFSPRADGERNAVTGGTVALGGAGASGDCVDGTCLNISPFASMVTVTATPEKQQQVADWLNLFKASITRQVYITAKVVEVSLDHSKSFGIDWSAVLTTAKGKISFSTDPSSTVASNGNSSFNLGVGDLALTAVLNALQGMGDVNVLASPSTAAMNQQKASFNVTRDVPFFTIIRTPIVSPTTGTITGYNETPSIQTAQVGIILDVLPQISSDNVVTMSIRPSVTSLVSTQTINSSSGAQAILPTTDRRETDTMARVRSGETVMIGGLIQTQITSERHGVPILMKLPALGRLFSHMTQIERHSEMVIFITPQIVSGQPPSGH